MSGEDAGELRTGVTWRRGWAGHATGAPDKSWQDMYAKAREGSGGLGHRNIDRDHPSCQLDGLGAKWGQESSEEAPTGAQAGGRGCPALKWWQHDGEDKFGEMRVMESKGPAGGHGHGE